MLRASSFQIRAFPDDVSRERAVLDLQEVLEGRGDDQAAGGHTREVELAILVGEHAAVGVGARFNEPDRGARKRSARGVHDDARHRARGRRLRVAGGNRDRQSCFYAQWPKR